MQLMRLTGIDVSHHQGKIDWNQVKNSGIDFAIVRVGYSSRSGNGGLQYDKRYVYNIQQCNKLGIPVGVYIYCYDRTPAAAAITTKALIKAIKSFKLEYPVIYDIEYDNEKLSKNVNTAIVNAAMKEIENAGYYGMVYASRDFFVNHLNMSDLKTTDKWEAAYRKVDDEVVQNGMWQYSSTGRVPGINGNVDMDYSYKDYPSIIKGAGLNGFDKVESVKEVVKQAETITTPNPIPRTEVKKDVRTVTANKLNVRKGPGLTYEAVKILKKGDKVTVFKTQDGWANIGNSEWVSMSFIK